MNEEEQSILILTNGYCVSYTLYSTVVARVEVMTQALPKGTRVTLKMLCGPEFWDALEKCNRIAAGRIVAYLVRNDQLGLRFVGCKHMKPKQYEPR